MHRSTRHRFHTDSRATVAAKAISFRRIVIEAAAEQWRFGRRRALGEDDLQNCEAAGVTAVARLVKIVLSSDELSDDDG